YVGDESNNRVQKFSPTGTYVTQWGTAGSGNGQFNVALGTAVDAAGSVYVADYSNSRVERCSGAAVAGSHGRPAFATQGPSCRHGARSYTDWVVDNFPDHPISLALDVAGNVYVTDGIYDQVVVYDNSGNYLREWPSPAGEAPPVLDNPAYIPHYLAHITVDPA